jgi:hypothetical protein
MLGPQAKFREKSTCAVKSKDKNIGAKVVVDRGIIKISFVNNLNKSASICQAPFLPIKVGPIRLWAKASNLRSDNITNNANNITSIELSRIASDII